MGVRTTGDDAFTITVNEFVPLRLGEPSSVTRTFTVLTVSAWATVGRQLNAPLPLMIVAPVGGLTSENDNVFAGISGSVAVAVKLMVCPGLTVRLVSGPTTGGKFTSLTITVKLFVSVRFVVLTALGLSASSAS